MPFLPALFPATQTRACVNNSKKHLTKRFMGGGGVLDSSKMVSSLATNDGDLWEYAKGKAFQNAGLPIVTIPTTSGTGSEVNCSGVISNLATQEKIGFGDVRNVPVLAIVDPELMKTVPAKYTAY